MLAQTVSPVWLSPHLHFKCCSEVFPGVVQLVAQHLHRQPLHHTGPGHHQLLIQTDPALRQRLQLSPQLPVAAAVSFSNLENIIKSSSRDIWRMIMITITWWDFSLTITFYQIRTCFKWSFVSSNPTAVSNDCYLMWCWQRKKTFLSGW